MTIDRIKYFFDEKNLVNTFKDREIERVSVSFSGGRTSGMMAAVVKKWARLTGTEVVYTFANTGLEHTGTYDFIQRCDEAFGLNVQWVEAVVNPEKGKGIRHKKTNFKDAVRDGEIYENMVKKHGIPTRATPHCTTYLKVYPMEHYLRSIGYKRRTYHTAIGIRADELDRINSNYIENKMWYPLADLGVTTSDVFEFWRRQPFDLEIPEHYGNCKTCWKKSARKLYEIYGHTPEEFDFFLKLDKLYSETNTFGKGARYMFRGGKNTRALIEDAKIYLKDASYFGDQLELDMGSSCEESCEVFNEDDWNFQSSKYCQETIGEL